MNAWLLSFLKYMCFLFVYLFVFRCKILQFNFSSIFISLYFFFIFFIYFFIWYTEGLGPRKNACLQFYIGVFFFPFVFGQICFTLLVTPFFFPFSFPFSCILLTTPFGLLILLCERPTTFFFETIFILCTFSLWKTVRKMEKSMVAVIEKDSAFSTLRPTNH